MKSREGTVVDADELVEEMVLTARRTSEELGKNSKMFPKMRKTKRQESWGLAH